MIALPFETKNLHTLTPFSSDENTSFLQRIVYSSVKNYLTSSVSDPDPDPDPPVFGLFGSGSVENADPDPDPDPG